MTPHMRVLVTGGTGVVGTATVTALVRRGYTVRLLSRHAREDVRQWPERVEPHGGDVADAASLRGGADGCAALIHLAAVVAESPPDVTFQDTNVEGTRNIIREAERAGVVRGVYVSSLGAERGTSPYHASKLAGERIALGARMNVTVVRLANVYGPGDEVISVLLKMIRMLPAVPTIDGGDDVFQPVWVGDAAAALVTCVERADLGGRILEVAGPDTTCMNDLIRRVRGITGRSPLSVPVPGAVAILGAKLASAIGIDVPIDRGQITMLEEGNVIRSPEGNALATVLRVPPTSLDDGLQQLADALPEQFPESGVGGLHRRRVWADIAHAVVGAEALFERFRKTFSAVTPWSVDVGTEPGTPTELHEGETMTMTLPLRGNVQVRVEELTPRKLTLVTLEGHPLAGAVRFLSEERGDLLRFEVQVYERAADIPDWLVMRTVGQHIQLGTWRSIVQAMVRESGGEAVDGVQHETETLDERQAHLIESWLRDLVADRKRGVALHPSGEPVRAPAGTAGQELVREPVQPTRSDTPVVPDAGTAG